MTRIAQFLNIRSGEGRLAGLLIALMLVLALGSSLGATGIETLFFARFGVGYLPLIYMIQGVTTLVINLIVTALLGRLSHRLIFIAIPIALGLVLVGSRFLVGFVWFFPVLWLLKEVINSLLGLYAWGVASMTFDTRQAKRLFPIFNAGRIFGSVVGGLATGFLVSLIGTENLLLVWAGTFAVAFLFTRLVVPGGPPVSAQSHARPKRVRRQHGPGFIEEMQQGWKFVRTSTLMKWVAVSAVLFSALYFSLALPFSKAATQQFPSEDALAGFLGTFNALVTAAAFLASLFAANRFYTRFGIMNAILALPIIYLAGFGMLAAIPAFSILVVFKFLQMMWMTGLADSAWQAMMNAVPAERRDQVRAFMSGVPEQGGTFMAGLILVIGEQALQSQQLYLIGLVVGLACTLVIWQARRAYGGALVAALRAGQPNIFLGQDYFGNIQRDSTALRVVINGLSNPDQTTRRASAEILSYLSAPQATASLVIALGDLDAEVRAASLRALAKAKAQNALLDVALLLKDADPAVRVQAVETVRELAGYAPGVRDAVEPLLEDESPEVRARAAVALLKLGEHARGHGPEGQLLRTMAALGAVEERVSALTALGDWGDAEAFTLIEMELADAAAPTPVRVAAARALAACGVEAAPVLVAALASKERLVREAAATALGQIGKPAIEATKAALFRPETEHGAIHAFELLPLDGTADSLRRFAKGQVDKAVHYHALYDGVKNWVGTPTDETAQYKARLLVESLRDKAQYHGLHALRAVNLLGDRQSLMVVMDNLRSRDPNQRANALETLESVREAALVKPMLKVWDESETVATGAAGDLKTLLGKVLAEPDAWLRACAVLVAGAGNEVGLESALNQLAETDPDPLVRGEARFVMNGVRMDTVSTLSLMERVLFFKRVPLFAELTPGDLKEVAALASEEAFMDGDVMCEQGELGNEMFVIAAGEVGVRVGEGNQEKEVARRKTGDVVGEMAIISQEPRMASLVAAGEVRVLCIDRKSFEGLLRERPEVSLAVMRTLCVRLKELSK